MSYTLQGPRNENRSTTRAHRELHRLSVCAYVWNACVQGTDAQYDVGASEMKINNI